MVIAGALALPLISSAQQLTKVSSLVQSIGNIVNLVIPIIFALALLGFFYGLILYFFGKDESKEKAKKTMIWGIVILFVMASVWGLVNFIQDAVGVNGGNVPSASALIPH